MPLLKNNRIFGRIFKGESGGGSRTASAGRITLFAVKLLKSVCLYSVLMGALSAAVLCLLLNGILMARAVRVQETLAAAVGGRTVSPFTQNVAQLLPEQSDIKFDAFNVVDMPPDASEDISGDSLPDAISIDKFRLAGTLPDVGAWLTVDNTTSLILRGQEFNGYVLDGVEPGEVSLTRDSESYPVYLTFYDPQVMDAPQARQEAETPVPAADAAPPGGGEVVAAAFNGNEGTIPRELVNELIMNPMEELRKVRLAPNENGEMTIQRIRSDSILNKLGLKRGDVLKGINDIPIKGGMDLVNVINSMMSSPRFDVSVNRGEEEGRLGYVVQ
ncbi:MAG: hypothetical protein LBO21_01320 [Synergistaceae bacterium]|jgi:hypothetical protein|nr:hypothetical protein [Synergistaceae bacterium]